MIGISFDSREKNELFADRARLPFPLLSDTDRRIALAYGACDDPRDGFARRIAYVIDENGAVAEAHGRVNPRTYPAEQLARL